MCFRFWPGIRIWYDLFKTPWDLVKSQCSISDVGYPVAFLCELQKNHKKSFCGHTVTLCEMWKYKTTPLK